MSTERDSYPDAVVTLRIELGRARLTFDELRGLRKGSIVVLDEAAGDPVNVYADGRLAARGEVVAHDGRYAVRITEIVSDARKRKSNAANRRPAASGVPFPQFPQFADVPGFVSPRLS